MYGLILVLIPRIADLPDQTFCKEPDFSTDLVTVGTLYVSDDPFWCASTVDALEPVPLLDAFTLKVRKSSVLLLKLTIS
jgi:hypothetical protein